MLVKYTNEDSKIIEHYIGLDYYKCLYLYLDLKQYGTQGDNISTYIQLYNNEIKAIVLTYYSCIHVYSKDNDFIPEEILELVRTNRFTMLYCAKEVADKIWDLWPTEYKAERTYGWVASIENVAIPSINSAIRATSEDFSQIVNLIYQDEDIGKSYDYKELAKQLSERAAEGYTRNIVIKDNQTVVAHACTNAEYGNIAVVAELVVHPQYRRRGYGINIWSCICAELLREGKEVFSFYYSKESRSLHKKIGFVERCEWCKIVIDYD